jgi:hypothetical protein
MIQQSTSTCSLNDECDRWQSVVLCVCVYVCVARNAHARSSSHTVVTQVSNHVRHKVATASIFRSSFDSLQQTKSRHQPNRWRVWFVDAIEHTPCLAAMA